MEVIAHWSGSYPSLCFGDWSLTIDDKDYTSMIPEKLATRPMGTFGEYSQWHFTDDWDEKWETYEDGLDFPEWECINSWVNDIPAPNNLIYEAFQKEDWRYNSCGGCI